MKVTLVLALLLLGVVSLSALDYDDDDDQWEAYKLEYNKDYSDNEDMDKYRKDIFLKNLNIIDEHNKRSDAGTESYEMGINEFSDMLESEIETIFSNNNFVDMDMELEELEMEMDSFESLELQNLRRSVNWTARGAVTPVRNQGKYNNSWAFAVADVIASRQFIHSGKLQELSKQILINCCHTHRDQVIHAFFCIEKLKGIDTEASYPYRGPQGWCNLRRNRTIGARIKKLYRLHAGHESKLASLVDEGPVLAVISHRVIQMYSRGIYNGACRQYSDFPVLIVGYGHHFYHGSYWILKTPLGTSWGEGGYMRLARTNRNLCGIANRVYYPIISSNSPSFWHRLDVIILMCLSSFSYVLLK